MPRSYAVTFLFCFQKGVSQMKKIQEAAEKFSRDIKKAGSALRPKANKTLGRHKLVTIGDLETALWLEYSIRVVFRQRANRLLAHRPDEIETLTKRLEDPFVVVKNVAELREAVRDFVSFPNVDGLSRTYLDKDDVMIISPKGQVANGNIKFENVRFKD